MNYLSRHFKSVLNAKYTQLEEETASFAYNFSTDDLFVTGLHIYFEWSNGATDWKNNFDFPAKPYRDMEDRWYAHRGFLKVWKVIEPHLKEVIMTPDIRYIHIYGYSHGAAIALLCHEYCKFHRPDIKVYGYGFGSPRVIWGFPNKRVKERFKGFRVIRNKGDIVTHLPPAIFGFRHYKVQTIGDGSYNCIDAHRPESYIKELDKENLS
jgi:predicted lipase